MFKKIIRRQFDGCNTTEDYLKIRRILRESDFEKELKALKNKVNVFDKMILGRNKDQFIDYPKFILTRDRFDAKEHYLLIPKNRDYFNILTLQKSDIPMLEEMKQLVSTEISGEKLLYFHCYPFNSVHTLHLHIVDVQDYIPRKNNFFIDDLIYSLQNENQIVLGITNSEEVENIILNWLSEHSISLLNLYVISLIIIKQLDLDKKLLPYSINFVLDFLLDSGKIDEKEYILEYFKDEKETLESIGDVLTYIAKNPYLLEKK